jgi:CelD/BcsL family acetyltransferase involved in cellulose biosynthesis
MRFGPVESTDSTVNAFLAALRARGWRLNQLRESHEFLLSVPQSLEMDRQLVSRIKQAAYKERRISRRGAVKVRAYTGLDRSEWGRVMSEVETIERGSWIAREDGLLIFSGPRNQAFWADFLTDRRASEATKVWLLYFNDQAVSHMFTLQSGAMRYILANSYMDTVKTLSTGVVLLGCVVDDAMSSGIQVINYGQGDGGYKSLWGFKPVRQLRDWLAFPPTLTGAALATALGVTQLLVKIKRRYASRASPHKNTEEEKLTP